MTPTISVVVPVHQARASVLPRALDSVGVQAGPFELEMVVVDDGSSDHSIRDVATRTSDRYPSVRVELVRLPDNRGVSAALNAGLDVAGGDFVALCGSDDEFAPSRLARQLKVVEPDDDVIVTGSLMWQPNVNPVPDPLVDATARDLILHRFGVSMFPHLYHRVVFEAHRFDPNLRSWGDWDVMLRVLRDGVRFVDCGDAVGVVHEDGGGRLTSSLSMAESLEYLLSKYAADIAAERGCRAEWEFRIGRRFALAGEVKSGLRWIRRSLRHDPLQRRRIGYALRLAKNRTPPPWDPYP